MPMSIMMIMAQIMMRMVKFSHNLAIIISHEFSLEHIIHKYGVSQRKYKELWEKINNSCFQKPKNTAIINNKWTRESEKERSREESSFGLWWWCLNSTQEHIWMWMDGFRMLPRQCTTARCCWFFKLTHHYLRQLSWDFGTFYSCIELEVVSIDR
jgi:hypothetical protein